MNQQLSKEQVDHLFDFVEERNVKYKDVQHELVDHLASSIEDVLTRYPSLSFEQARDTVYRRFPITGFVYFVQEKEKAMTQYWRAKQWSYVKTYFTLPKVVMTMAWFAGLATLFALAPVWLSASAYMVLALVAYWIAAVGQEVDHESSRWGYYYGEPLMAAVLAPLLLFGSEGTHFQLLGVLTLVTASMVFVARRRSRHSYEDRQQFLVIRSFYTGWWRSAAGLLLIPAIFSEFVIFEAMGQYYWVAVLMAGLATVVLVALHAFQTHLTPLLEQELSEKYPYLDLKLTTHGK